MFPKISETQLLFLCYQQYLLSSCSLVLNNFMDMLPCSLKPLESLKDIFLREHKCALPLILSCVSFPSHVQMELLHVYMIGPFTRVTTVKCGLYFINIRETKETRGYKIYIQLLQSNQMFFCGQLCKLRRNVGILIGSLL